MTPYEERAMAGARPLKNAVGPSLTAMSLITCIITLPFLALVVVSAPWASLNKARRVFTTHIGVVQIIATSDACKEITTVVQEFGFDGS